MNRKKGFIMIFALVIIMLIIFSIGALSIISYNDLAIAGIESKNMRAYYLAEAGIARKFMELRDNNNGNIGPTNVTFTDGTGTYSVAVTVAPRSSAPDTTTGVGAFRRSEDGLTPVIRGGDTCTWRTARMLPTAS